MHQQDESEKPRTDFSKPEALAWTEVTEISERQLTENKVKKFIISDSIPNIPANKKMLIDLKEFLRNAQQKYNNDNMPKSEVYESYEVDGQLKGTFTITETSDGLQMVASLNREAFAAITDIDIIEIALEDRTNIPPLSQPHIG
ncbi:MAG: hypothetical protein KGJ06_09960 [Pseudomonadota bacterium]|nr:hypothetical protein [Pseudomonadota bacterium]